MDGPALLHGASRLGAPGPAAKSKGAQLRSYPVQPNWTVPSGKSEILAGVVANPGGCRFLSGYTASARYADTKRGFILQRVGCEAARHHAFENRGRAGGA